MRAIYLVLFMVYTFVSYGQRDIKTFKSRKIIITHADSVVEARTLRNNGKVNVSDDKVYYWYQSNRVYSNKGGYSGKLLDGLYKVFNRDGNLVTEGNFKSGLKVGEWKTWYKNGELRIIGSYKDGKREGKFRLYNSKGILRGVKNFKNDKLHGKQLKLKDGKETISRYNKGIEVVKKTKVKKESKDKEKEENQKKIKPAKEDKIKETKEKDNASEKHFFRRIFTKSSDEEKEDVAKPKGNKNLKKDKPEKGKTKKDKSTGKEKDKK